MPQACSVCTHKKVEEINRLLLSGTSLRNIAEQYGLSVTPLHRHKTGHIPAALTQAKEAQEVTQADDLLQQVKDLQQKACQLLAAAEKSGDLRTALVGVREAKSCLELLAKLQGELQQEGAINVTLAPEWLELRAVILQSVEPHPEAKQRLLKAIKGVESHAGR